MTNQSDNAIEQAILNLAKAAKEVEEAMNEAYAAKRTHLHGHSYSPSVTARCFVHQEVADIIKLYAFEECQLGAIHGVNAKWQPTTAKPQLPNFI